MLYLLHFHYLLIGFELNPIVFIEFNQVEISPPDMEIWQNGYSATPEDKMKNKQKENNTERNELTSVREAGCSPSKR